MGGEERARGEGLAGAEVGREVGGREAGKGGGREEGGGVVNVLLSISVYSSPSESPGDRERQGETNREQGNATLYIASYSHCSFRMLSG